MKNKLRSEAENIISKLAVTDRKEIADIDRIFHELQVHQIELELQNDELRRTTEELEISNKRYSDLFEFAPVGYLLLDNNTRILNLNLTAVNMLGKERSSLIPKPLTGFILPDSQDSFYFHIQKVLKSTERQSAEIVFKKYGGKVFSTQIQSILYNDSDSGQKKILSALIDITESKEIESRLKRFRAAIDSSADNIFLINYATLEFIDVNESACRNLGYTRKELLSLNPGKLIPEYSQKYTLSGFYQLFENEKVTEHNIETRHQRKDGSIIDVELYIKVVNIDSEKIIVTVARDISERKKIQEKLQAYADELKELNTSKDKFLSIISHDLRGPFLGLNGYTQMLMEDYDSLSREEVLNYLSKISEASKDLYNLVDNLLKWSRLQLGKIPFEPMSFNLFNELEPLIKLLSGVAKRKNITLINQLQKDVHPYADRLMLISVTQNLVSNAIKFTRKGGTIKVSSYLEDGTIFIKVEDNGIGMDEKMLEKIFTLEKEFSSRGTAGEKGTGFGLMIAREMVQKMGGDIWVVSIPEKGSVFKFSLKNASIA